MPKMPTRSTRSFLKKPWITIAGELLPIRFCYAGKAIAAVSKAMITAASWECGFAVTNAERPKQPFPP
jgi:hypothetical protein